MMRYAEAGPLRAVGRNCHFSWRLFCVACLGHCRAGSARPRVPWADRPGAPIHGESVSGRRRALAAWQCRSTTGRAPGARQFGRSHTPHAPVRALDSAISRATPPFAAGRRTIDGVREDAECLRPNGRGPGHSGRSALFAASLRRDGPVHAARSIAQRQRGSHLCPSSSRCSPRSCSSPPRRRRRPRPPRRRPPRPPPRLAAPGSTTSFHRSVCSTTSAARADRPSAR
jgi:hypothetical protein